MANRLDVVASCLVVLLGGMGCAHAAPGQSYCERLDEMRLMPFKSDDTVGDEIYNGLRSQGKEAAACLLGRVTDTRLMPDPRKAPPYGGYAVGDAAVGVLLDICNMSIEDALPAHVRAKWSEQGVYAYFAFVKGGIDNRQKIADALERQGCD